MHDPNTVAFDIKYPWYKYKPGAERMWPKGYRDTFITIWHRDPEKRGSDDSCGWFKRASHGDPKVLEKIQGAFESEWDSQYLGWFHPDGQPKFSLHATTIGLFQRAAFIYFDDSWSCTHRFMKKHLYNIISFAENTTDSFADSLKMKYGFEPKERRIQHFAAVIYGCLLRWNQPWYDHPRWHIHHWRLQIHPAQQFKRWAFSRCAGCRKRFSWGYSPTTFSWNGTGPRWFRGEVGVYHQDCTPSTPRSHAPIPEPVGMAN